MALVINRKAGQAFNLTIGNEKVRVLVNGWDEREGAKISIFAPPSVEILREELKYDSKKRADFLHRKSPDAAFNK